MAFKQSTVVSGEYTQYDAAQNRWVSYSLRTYATDIVINSPNRLFIQNGTHAVNGKKFYTESNGTYTAQAITLYGSDIQLSSNESTNIATAISSINSNITDLNTFKNTTVPNTYLDKTIGGTVTGALTLESLLGVKKGIQLAPGNGFTLTEGDASLGFTADGNGMNFTGAKFNFNEAEIKLEKIADADESCGTNGQVLTSYNGGAYWKTLGVSSSSASGLMSSTDKSHLDSMWSIWSADGADDTLVNKVQEVLKVFENMSEGSDLASLLAGKQNKVSALGSTTEPVYVSADGTFSKADKFAGGTAVTLNGSSKAGSTASFYAPTSVGTNGYLLKSSGSGTPTWVDGSTLFITTSNGGTANGTIGATLINSTTGYRFNGGDDLHLNDRGRLIYGSGGVGEILAYSSEVPVITVSATAPTNPKTGDIWINTAA